MTQRRTRRRFTREFKAQAVQHLLESGKPLSDIAAELGLSPGQLSQWRNGQLAAGALGERLAACGLVLHPQKTKIVYCKDTNRGGRYPVIQFDFLGYTFRPRLTAWPNGNYGVAFLPGASQAALKAMRREVRRWALQTRTDKALDDLARMFNP